MKKPMIEVEAGVKEPICFCGDWKHQHVDGKGKCICTDFGGCTQFRFGGYEVRPYDEKLDKDLFDKRVKDEKNNSSNQKIDS